MGPVSHLPCRKAEPPADLPRGHGAPPLQMSLGLSLTAPAARPSRALRSPATLGKLAFHSGEAAPKTPHRPACERN